LLENPQNGAAKISGNFKQSLGYHKRVGLEGIEAMG